MLDDKTRVIFILASGEREKWRRAKIYHKRKLSGSGFDLIRTIATIAPPRSRPWGGTRTEQKMSSEKKRHKNVKVKENILQKSTELF